MQQPSLDIARPMWVFLDKAASTRNTTSFSFGRGTSIPDEDLEVFLCFEFFLVRGQISLALPHGFTWQSSARNLRTTLNLGEAYGTVACQIVGRFYICGEEGLGFGARPRIDWSW